MDKEIDPKERLEREKRRFERNPPPNCTTGLNEDIFHWYCTIMGPVGSPYEGGVFHLRVIHPPTYPYVPPRVSFCTKIYHPNISEKGNIDLDLLRERWSPGMSIDKVLLVISSLLDHPNPEDALVQAIAEVYKNDRSLYIAMARSVTEEFAMGCSSHRYV